MKIHGLMKMTLLDYPGLVACTVFLGGCDMRCPYCHNWELVDASAPAVMEEEDLLHFLEGRRGLLDGVVITGGEPLLRRDLQGLVEKVKKLGFQVKLDTNGNHPDRLQEILDTGLIDYVAMDVKNSPDRYGVTIGLPDFDPSPIGESIRILLRDQVPYEFRTTVVKQFHDRDSFLGIGDWIRGAKRYYLQGFVDRETVPYKGLEACTGDQMEEFLEIVRPCVEEAAIRGM